MKLLIPCIVAACLCVESAQVLQAQWVQTSGPFGSSTNSVLGRADELYIATYSGICQSLDNGNTWTSVRSEVVYSLGFAGDAILAGTFSGLRRSTDNGGTWVVLEPHLGSIFCLASDDARAYLGGETGIFVSDDDGANWVPGGWVPGVPQALALQGEYVFVGTSTGVARSSDHGMSWAPANQGLGNRNVHAIAASQSALLAGTDGGIFRSTDMGSTWSAASEGTAGSVIVALAFAGDGATAIAGSPEQGLFRSSDGGTSWTAVGPAIPVFSVTTVGEYAIAGIVGGTLRSTDRGLTWEYVHPGVPTAEVFDLYQFGTDVFAGTDSGIWRWDPGHTTWISLHFPRNAFGLASLGDGLWVGTDYSGLFRSTDQGTSWPLVEKDQLQQTVIFSICELSSYLFLGTTAGVFRSEDRGSNWTLLSDSLVQGTVFTLLFFRNDPVCRDGASGSRGFNRLWSVMDVVKPRQWTIGLSAVQHARDRLCE